MSNISSINELSKKAEEVSREIYETREHIKQLKEKKEKLFNELSKLREEKNKLLEEIRRIKLDIRAIREERGKLIDEYKKISEVRREELAQANLLRELISSKTTELQELSKEIRIPISVLKRKIEELEWTIQTNVLTQEKENELIRKLKAYHQLLNRALSANERKEEVLELRATYISTRARIRDLSSKLNKLREEISEKTNKMKSLKDELRETVTRYTTIKNDIENKKKELDECNNEIVNSTSKLNALREQYQKLLDEIEKAKTLTALSEKRSKIAKNIEQRSKKRVTLEEFKIMYGNPEDLEEN